MNTFYIIKTITYNIIYIFCNDNVVYIRYLKKFVFLWVVKENGSQ